MSGHGEQCGGCGGGRAGDHSSTGTDLLLLHQRQDYTRTMHRTKHKQLRKNFKISPLALACLACGASVAISLTQLPSDCLVLCMVLEIITTLQSDAE